MMTGWAEWAIYTKPTFATIQGLIDSWDASWPLTNAAAFPQIDGGTILKEVLAATIEELDHAHHEQLAFVT